MGTLTLEQVTEAAAQYAAGKSTLKLGEQYGVSRQTVTNALVKHGVQMRPGGPYQGHRGARAFTDAQAQEAVELFKAGFNGMRIAEHFGVSDTTVRKSLKRSGIEETDSKIKIKAEQVPEVLEQYARNISTYKIAAQLGVSPQTVANTILRNGGAVKPQGQYRVLSLHEGAFDILTPDSTYWLGMMATDGCVTGTDDVVDEVKLGLQLIDYHHVAAFREFLGSGHKISLAKWRHPAEEDCITLGWRLAIRSKSLVTALSRFGVIQRKTYTLIVKNGVENNTRFWTGAVDGDGHVGIHAQNQGPDATLKLTGASKPFIEQFRAFLKTKNVRGDNSVVEEARDRSCYAKVPKYVLKLGGNAALDATALLYTNCTQAMSRKARAAAEMIIRGSEGDLVGTIRTKWENPHAVEWAREYLRVHPEEKFTLPQDAIDRLSALPREVVEKLSQATIDLIAPLCPSILRLRSPGAGVNPA